MNPNPALQPSARTGWFALGLVLLLAWLSVLSVQPPAVAPLEAPEQAFSAARAMVHVRDLADAPHPVGSAAQAQVVDRLEERMAALGLIVRRQRGEAAGVPLTNLIAERPGSEDGQRLLLMAHSDSVAGGPGAGDDASGAAALLEVMRALERDPPGRHGLVFLITDGEEAGLLGARLFVEQPGSLDGLAAVINVEARGSSGPSTLFEHGPESGGLVARWAAEVPHPFGSSMGPFVYERMPNDTDLTPFRRAGLPGLNLAFFGGADVYHQAMDRPEHLDPRSLQHHGANVLAFARSWARSGPDGSVESGGHPVFFSVPGWGMVVIGADALGQAWIGLGLLALLMLFPGVSPGWWDGVLALPLMLVVALLPCALAGGLAYLLGGPRGWGDGPTPGNGAATLWVSSGVLVTALGGALLAGSGVSRRWHDATVFLLLVASVVLTRRASQNAPGLSYLPLLVGASAAIQWSLCRRGHVIAALLVGAPAVLMAGQHAHLLAHVGSVSPAFVGVLAAGGALLALTGGLPGLLAAGRVGGRAPGMIALLLGAATIGVGASGLV